MKKYMNHKMKLAIALGISTLFIVTTISSAGLLELNKKVEIGTTTPSAEPEVQESIAFNDTITSNPGPLGPLGNDNDWNYWSNPPHMFPYVTGNIGIGTSTPNGKLEVLSEGEDILIGADSHNPSIELRDLDGDGGSPFIDFANDGATDFDMRIILTGDNALSIFGGNLGINTSSPLAKFHVNEGAVLFSGTAGGTPISGAGTRFMWIPAKAAFRAGIVVNDWWDDSNIGSYSVAMGFNPKAKGSGSTALGVLAEASGLCSTAIGGGHPWAAGEQSIAMGSSTYASGLLSTAMGYFTMAGGKYSTAMGVQTGASGEASTAMGHGTKAFGNTSTAMGHYTNASGKYSTAMGDQTKASGTGSTAMGYLTKATQSYSTAMGTTTTASGKYSTAMGSTTKASGICSTAMGFLTTASGNYSTAMGYNTTASGLYSTAMGWFTKAGGKYSTAMGQTMTVNGKGSFGIGLNFNATNWLVSGNNVMSIMGGRVGIGTTNPQDLLHINGYLRVEGAGNEAAYIGGSGSGKVLIGSVNSDITTVAFYNRASGAYMAGVMSYLTLKGGGDIAEPFDVKENDKAQPGMVLSIDTENPGKLKVSEKAYDRCVAGIISGAGDIKPGIIMGQEGSLAYGKYPVALAGRVYCLCDASYGSIHPGDLLTTSSTPGYAMKVTDYENAQGAILGKAMTSLETGKGLVLILVSLQ